jgi:outer membrane protein OmpA-like peptidoglycan-associated protein
MYPFAQETDARTLFARWVQPTLRPSQSFIPATEGTAITSLVLTAENFTSPVTSFTLRSGSLPAGLTLTKTADYTAEISGTPTAEESGCFHFDATNGTESAGTASCIIISVAAAPEPPSSGGEDSDNSTPPANNDSATPPIGDNSLPNNVSPVSNTPASPAQAPSTASSGRTDTKVYSRKLPTTTQVDTTLTVLTKKASKTQMLRTRTPKVCVNLTQSVVLVKAGTCRLEVLDKSTKRVVRSLSTRVRTDETTAGTTVNGQDAISFQRISTRLSASARAQVAELATTAAEAKRVILIGHTASLTENNVSNNRIALQRAAAVKAALRAEFKKAGVKVPISIVSVGPNAPLTTKKSNSAQARNRRVEVFIIQ